MLYTIKTAPFFFFIFLGFSSLGCSQPADTTLFKLEKAKSYANKIAAYDFYSENPEPYIDYNDSLADLLTSTLKNKNIFDLDLEKIFKNSEISYTKSTDDKLHVLNWFANYGGSFKMYFEVVLCKTPGGNHRVVVEGETIKTEKIFSVTTKNKDTIYLIETFGRTCNTCIDQYLSAYTITEAGLEEKIVFFGEDYNFVGVEARVGDIITFDYSEKKETITIEYIVDDLSRGNTMTDDGDTIKLIYKFNGTNFVKN